MLAAAHSVCPEIHYKTSRRSKETELWLPGDLCHIFSSVGTRSSCRNQKLPPHFLWSDAVSRTGICLLSGDTPPPMRLMPALSVQSRKIMLSFFCSWELTHLNLGSSRTLLVLHPPPAPPSLKTLPLETQKRKKKSLKLLQSFHRKPQSNPPTSGGSRCYVKVPLKVKVLILM